MKSYLVCLGNLSQIFSSGYSSFAFLVYCETILIHVTSSGVVTFSLLEWELCFSLSHCCLKSFTQIILCFQEMHENWDSFTHSSRFTGAVVLCVKIFLLFHLSFFLVFFHFESLFFYMVLNCWILLNSSLNVTQVFCASSTLLVA